jgi:hypothetical protein
MSELLIMQKQIDIDRCPVLFDRPFGPDSLTTDWQVRTAEWWIEDEWLTGRNPGNFPGMVTSRERYFGNILLEFEARTVPPSTHDINCMWNGSWEEDTNTRGVAYVAGLEGWWEGKVGFEKSPDYKLNAANPTFDFEPGRTYFIQVGSIDGHVFVFVDRQLVLEVTDPEPIDTSKHGLVGFEAYSSWIQVRRPVIRQIVWEERKLSYESEF